MMKVFFKICLLGIICLSFFNILLISYAAQTEENIAVTKDVRKMSDQASKLSGKAAEVINSGGYTYVLLEKNGKKTWVAVPVTDVKVGEEIAFQPGSVMSSFTSKTLNRTFENIIFSTGPIGGGNKSKGTTSSSNMLSSHGSSAEPPEKIKIGKAPGANAYTVSELYEKKDQLNKKQVVIKGKVVKVSAAIMNKNWIHLQDGTGNSEKGNNDLVVTSKELPNIGEVIQISGTIYKDKDFGSGYKYKVIVEDAKIMR